LTACQTTPSLEGQSILYINPGAGWPSLTAMYRPSNLVAFYNLHGLQWDFSFPRSPHGEEINMW